MSELKELVYSKLWEQFRHISEYPVDHKGYLCKPGYNLISGLRMADFRDELQKGGGQELKKRGNNQ